MSKPAKLETMVDTVIGQIDDPSFPMVGLAHGRMIAQGLEEALVVAQLAWALIREMQDFQEFGIDWERYPFYLDQLPVNGLTDFEPYHSGDGEPELCLPLSG